VTNWDQLDAMGNLARLNQAKALAQQQAARDTELAKQNAEVVRLLKEQKEREETEKARIDAMPKCPDCRSPVAVGSRRCPACRSDIVAWEFEHRAYPWRMVCRASEAQQVLEDRCKVLLETARSLRDKCSEAAAIIDIGWQTQMQSALDALDALISRYSPGEKQAVRALMRRAALNKPLYTEQERITVDAIRQSIYQFDDRIKMQEETLRSLARRAKASPWPLIVLIGGVVWFAVSAFAFVARPPHVTPDFSVVHMCGGIAAAVLGLGLRLLNSARLRGIDKDRSRMNEMIARSRQERQIAEDAAKARENSTHTAWMQKLKSSGLWDSLEQVRRLVEQGKNAHIDAKETSARLKAVLSALVGTLELGQNERLLPANAFAGFASSIRVSCIDAAQSSDVSLAAGRLTSAEAITEERRIATKSIQTLVEKFNELRIGLDSLEL